MKRILDNLDKDGVPFNNGGLVSNYKKRSEEAVSLNPIANLLKTDAILFWSSYGSKAVAESWTQRLNKQIKSVETNQRVHKI